MINIYTDGSCSFNKSNSNNLGGYSFVAINESGLEICSFAEGTKNTTNNRMEMMAVIAALEKFKQNFEPLTIHSDSEYVVKCMNEKWWEKWIKNDWKIKSQEVKNKDLWIIMLDLLSLKNNVTFKWVKGHSVNNVWNEKAHNLAFEKTKNDKIRIINK
jgi:ribonuclease HI